MLSASILKSSMICEKIAQWSIVDGPFKLKILEKFMCIDDAKPRFHEDDSHILLIIERSFARSQRH